MKKILIIIAFLFISKLSFSKALFTVAPTFPISGGKIALRQNGSQTVAFDLSINREYNLSTHDFEDVTARIEFIYRTPTEDKVMFTKEITSSGFNGGSTMVAPQEISYPAYVANSKVVVKLIYQGETKEVSVTDCMLEVVIVSPRPLAKEGDFVRIYSSSPTVSERGKVYVAMDGYYRHIVDVNTLNGLFTSGIQFLQVDNLSDYWSTPVGNPLGTNTRLVKDVNNGKIYFQEGNLLRHIISPDVASLYHFKTTNTVNIPNLNGYVIGEKVSLKTVIEGSLVRPPDGKIYVIMNGTARHIVDGQTYAAIFAVDPPITSVSNIDITPFPLGNPIVLGSRLVKDITTGKIYLQDGPSILRYITSPAVADRYSINLAYAQEINGLGTYSVGTSLQ